MERSQGKGKARANREPTKRNVKIVIRKLPIRDYDLNQFITDLKSFCDGIVISADPIRVDHFLQGKLSRKRGPVNGAAFLSISDEAVAKCLIDSSKTTPFLRGEENQPTIMMAPYQKTFKLKETAPKFQGTYESDPEYIAFLTGLEAPVAKRPSADSTDPAVAASKPKPDPMESALLRYLLERGARRLTEKRSLRSLKRGERKEIRGGKTRLSRSERRALRREKTKAGKESSEELTSSRKSRGGRRSRKPTSANATKPLHSMPLVAALANSNATIGMAPSDPSMQAEIGKSIQQFRENASKSSSRSDRPAGESNEERKGRRDRKKKPSEAAQSGAPTAAVPGVIRLMKRPEAI